VVPMPSAHALQTFVTGPSNVPLDGQSISAPLCTRFGPLSHQHLQSVSDTGPHRKTSGSDSWK
jgi:hypothetical protein